jgi:hypothetical protein
MRGKNARFFRQMAGFHPTKTEREYKEWVIVEKTGLVHRLLPDGSVETVEKTLQRTVIECVSKERKFYKELKRNFAAFKAGQDINLNINPVTEPESGPLPQGEMKHD